MSEIEAPIEQVQEHIHEAAHHNKENWISGVALYSALVAAAAAVSALLAGHHSDEAMITQIRAANQWNYYQAKGIKASVLSSKVALLTESGKAVQEEDHKNIERYKEEQDSISEKAKELESESEQHLKLHSLLAKAVTFFQVAIAIGAISVLTKRRRYWFVSMVFSAIGLVYLGMSFFH